MNTSTLTISSENILKNYNKICTKVGSTTEVGAVVKADAYGLGMDVIVPKLAAGGCKTFFVGSVTEGITLRNLLPDVAIYVLTGVSYHTVGACVGHKLIPVIYSLEQFDLLLAEQRHTKGPVEYAIKFDTGMGRLGFSIEQIHSVVQRVVDYGQQLKLRCVFSHLACADEATHPLNKLQLERFVKIKSLFPPETKFSLCNSSGVLLGKEYHFDLVRPGAFLYGICESSSPANDQLNVIYISAEVLQIKCLSTDSYISYGGTYHAKHGQKIVTIRAGYADGYFRALSNRGYVVAYNKRLPIIGIVTMDMVMVDGSLLSDEEFYTLKYLEILGDNVTIGAIAKTLGTIGYEVLTSLGNRYTRIYK